MKTIILRLLQVVLLAVLVIISVNVLEPLRPVKLSEEKQAAAEETVREIKESMKADISSESGNTALENRSKDTAALENKERIACIDDNEEALVLRLRMIEAAKESLVFATFDFRADESGSAMMAAFYAAAERGVKVSLLLDGMNEFLYLERSELFKALCTHENVEVRVYNPIDAFHILKGNYRMLTSISSPMIPCTCWADEIPMTFSWGIGRPESMRIGRSSSMSRRREMESRFRSWRSILLPSGRKAVLRKRRFP